jgi:ribosome recycling factor
MTEEINFNLDVAKEAMQEAMNRLESALAKIRAGKANPQMLSTVKVDYYGVQTPLTQAANVLLLMLILFLFSHLIKV